MPDEEEDSGGGAGGGNVVDEGNLNEGCQFIDGQWVCPDDSQPNIPAQPNVPSQTQCPSCDQLSYAPPSGTRGSYYWDSQDIIKKATAPLNKKEDKK